MPLSADAALLGLSFPLSWPFPARSAPVWPAAPVIGPVSHAARLAGGGAGG
ncbi:MAG: hypothetical protein K9G43_08730 [Rhodobacteraceae bacterium]|nr:hypothetical protein [Paracoccaceae bacterium]